MAGAPFFLPAAVHRATVTQNRPSEQQLKWGAPQKETQPLLGLPG